MSSEYLRIKFFANGKYVPVLYDLTRREVDNLDMFLDRLFNNRENYLNGDLSDTHGCWYEIETCDDDQDILIYCVCENPHPKNGSMIESRIRRPFPEDFVRKWGGIQYRLSKEYSYMFGDAGNTTVNMLFQFEEGPVTGEERDAAERKLKEDSLKAMEENLILAESRVLKLRKEIDALKAELATPQ